MADLRRLDPATVCGLISERGEAVRAGTYEHRWQRDNALLRAVSEAIRDAGDGARPATPSTSPPSWLAPLVRDHLGWMATHWSHESAFDPIRLLERLELVSLEPDENYVLAAVGGIGGPSAHTRAQALRDDPALIDRVVWRMFEVEGGGEVSLANVEKFSPGGAGWQPAFVELTADGTLPRERVLTSALSALNRDFSAYRAGWYARLYDALEPTIDEVAGHQGLVRALLRSTVTATVSFAVNKLKLLSKHGLLDGAATLPALRPAVVASPKSTAAAAVRLVAEVVRRDATLAGQAVEVAAIALDHPHADVQRAAATLLGMLGADDRVQGAAEYLEPSVRADVLGQSLAAARVEAVPRLAATGAQLVPSTREDVLDRLAALLENAGDAMEVELVLAALGRLDDVGVLRPLAKRATSILARGPRDGITPVTPAWLRGQLARLVLAAAGEALPAVPAADSHTIVFLLHRLRAVEEVMRGRRPPLGLLATPDHPQGWIAATTLVERLQRAVAPPDQYDLTAALLRLHPDDRPLGMLQAGEERGALTGPVARVVMYALGGPPPAAPRLLRPAAKLSHIPLWIAASRARMPLRRDEWLASRGIDGAGRADPIEAAVEFRHAPYSWTEGGRTRSSTYSTWLVDVVDPARDLTDHEPTAAAAGDHHRFGSTDAEDFVGWLASIWPHDCEHFLVTAVHPVLRAAAFDEVSHDAIRVLDAISLHPGRLGSLTFTTLAAGLTASRADQRAHAEDAVLHLHGAGRLDATQLAGGLMSIAGIATVTRLATTLSNLAADGPVTANFVIDALGAALPTFGPDRRGLHALLELLREELLRNGRRAPGELRPWLGQFQGSSRSAKAAAALLALM